MNNQLKNLITTSLIRRCLLLMIGFTVIDSRLHASEQSESIEYSSHLGFSAGYVTGKAGQLTLSHVNPNYSHEDWASFREDGLQFSLHMNSNRFFPTNGLMSPNLWFVTISYASLDVQFASYEQVDEYLKNFEETFDIFVGIQKNLQGSNNRNPFLEVGFGYRYEESLYSEFIRSDNWPWGPHSVIASGASSSGQGLIWGFGGGYYFHRKNSPNLYCIGVHGMVGPRSEGISRYINDLAYLVRFQIYIRYEIGIKL